MANTIFDILNDGHRMENRCDVYTPVSLLQ